MSSTLTREFFRKNGATGGRKAAANMTPEERRARALKASRAAQVVRREKAKEAK